MIKNHIKFSLAKIGFWPFFDNVRRISDIVHWGKNGCCGVAPAPIKRRIIWAYICRFGVKEFVETGTHLGDTLAYVSLDHSIKCISIELAEGYFQIAKSRFAHSSNVSLLHGDSGRLMREIVPRLERPTLFWLDGHYSGGDTGRGQTDTPISDELVAIMESPINGHVILIDDARCFDGTNGYPHLDELLALIRATDRYFLEISTDIIRLSPKSHTI